MVSVWWNSSSQKCSHNENFWHGHNDLMKQTPSFCKMHPFLFVAQDPQHGMFPWHFKFYQSLLLDFCFVFMLFYNEYFSGIFWLYTIFGYVYFSYPIFFSPQKMMVHNIPNQFWRNNRKWRLVLTVIKLGKFPS